MSLVFQNVIVNEEINGSRTTVRAATTANGTLASDFEAGDVIDGVNLAAGDYILIKDQTTATENGIYIVETTGAPTRASYLDTGKSANSVWTWVREGTANASSAYICTSSPGSDVVGTDNLTFTQYDVTGVLPISRGGTGTSSLTPGTRVIQTNAAATALETTTTPQLTEIRDTNDNELIIFTGTVSAVNEFEIINNSTGLAPIFASSGEANIGMLLQDSNGNELLTLTSVASAVNDVQITNSATGINPVISSEGEPNIGVTVSDSNGNEILIMNSTAAAVNEFSMDNAATGNAPILSTTGETNVDMEFNTAGTGAFIFGANDSSTSAELRMEDNTGGQYGAWTVPASVTTSFSLILPDGVGTAGQMLTTDGNNPAQLSWTTPAASAQYISVVVGEVRATRILASVVGYFSWDDSEYGSFTTNSVIFWYDNVSNRDLTVEVYDETNATSLGTTTISSPAAAAIGTFTFTDPVGDASLSIRISKSAFGGTSPRIFGLQLKFV